MQTEKQRIREKGKFPGVTTHKTWQVNFYYHIQFEEHASVPLVHSDTFVGNEAYMLKGEFLFSIIFKLTR